MRNSTPCVVVKLNLQFHIETPEWEVQLQKDVTLPTDTDYVVDSLLLEGNEVLIALKRKRFLLLN